MTDEPIWLELEDVFEIHAAIIGGTSAQAADLLRNRSALLSALDRPPSAFVLSLMFGSAETAALRFH